MLTDVQRETLARGAAQWGLILPEDTLDLFSRFAGLLEIGNRERNLTRIRPDDVVTLHFLDSLALAAVAPPTPGMRLLDVGTGAGFPGIPLALAYPDLQVTLLDSTRKRLDFIQQALKELQVPAQTIHGRAEDMARDPVHRERYDLVTARAVARLETLAGWVLPFARTGGLAVAFKSRDANKEIDMSRPKLVALGARLEQVAEVTIPSTDISRKLVLMRKKRSIPLNSG